MESTENTVDTTEVTQGQPEVAASTPEPADKSPELPGDYEQRLRWDNQTQASIDLLKTLPHDEAMRIYDGISKRQDRTDKLYHERETLERANAKQRAELEAPVEQQPEPKTLKSLLGDDADLLDPKVVEALQTYMDERNPAPMPVEQQPQAPPRDRIERIEAEVQSIRARYQDMYPGVRLDGAEWDAVARKADAESNNGSYSFSNFDNMPAELDRVFAAVMYREYGAPQNTMRETTNNSGPTTRNSAASASSTTKPPKTLTEKERAKIVWDHLQRNPKDVSGARVAAGYPPRDPHSRDDWRKP